MPKIAWHQDHTDHLMYCKKHLPMIIDLNRRNKMEHVRIRGVRYSRACYHAHRRNPTAVSKRPDFESNEASWFRGPEA